jgi:hypothetical protein
MPLPDAVRVKLSSEAADAISLTPVVVREMPLRELVEYMLGVTGKDEARVRELLLRGTLVSGASRFRWAGWEAEPGAIAELLATFPDPEPSRAFAAARCTRMVLRGGRQAIEIPRQAAERTSFFRRATFWNLLLEVAGKSDVRYQTYSYKDRADVYQAALDPAAAQRLRANARMIAYSILRDRIARQLYTSLELFVGR